VIESPWSAAWLEALMTGTGTCRGRRRKSSTKDGVEGKSRGFEALLIQKPARGSRRVQLPPLCLSCEMLEVSKASHALLAQT
jgi:hypothetical protein